MGSIKKVIYTGREFVNLPGDDDTGYIQAEIKWEHNYGFDDDDYEDDDDKDSNGAPGSIDYKLKFADCQRSIDFNIQGDSPSERKNSIHKVDKMIQVLTEFRSGLDEAFQAEEHIKNVRAARKKEKEAELKEAIKEKEDGEEKEGTSDST